MGSIVTSSFEPTLPEALEHRWVDYFTGLETSPFCNGSAVSLPFRVGTLLEADPACGPNAAGVPLGDGLLESDPPQSRAPRAGFP
jgi:hypothetical protein